MAKEKAKFTYIENGEVIRQSFTHDDFESGKKCTQLFNEVTDLYDSSSSEEVKSLCLIIARLAEIIDKDCITQKKLRQAMGRA